MQTRKLNLYNIKRITENIEETNVIGKLKVCFESVDNKEKITTTKIINNIEVENSYVVYDKDTFKPIESFNKYTIENGVIEYKANFSKKSIKMKAKDPVGLKRRILSNEDKIFDNIQIYSLMKTLNFSNDDILCLKIFSNILGRYEDCEIKFYGKEKLEINGINYNAVRISLTLLFCNVSQFFLFSDDKDKTLLKTIIGNEILEFDCIEKPI